MALNVEMTPYQREFAFSVARNPCMKSGWGTGKTMMGIMKIWTLANVYKDNLLLVCRENYTNLLNSTIQDFQLYTGRKVKVQAKRVDLPNGSTILFSHADTVAGVVQNINLGGFLIEQAEEFDDSSVFAMLNGGRMRRKLELDERYFEQLDAEFAQEPPQEDARAFYEYIRTHTGDHALNQGILIANACGRNWIWGTYKRAGRKIDGGEHWCKWEMPPGPRVEGQCECARCKEPDLVMWDASTFANAHNLKPDFLANHLRMRDGTQLERRKYRMYVENLDDEIDLEGAYYDEQMSQARRDGRIGHFPPDRSAATHTMWDLGATKNPKGGDSTAIWWFQVLAGGEIRMVHYYEASSAGLEHYIRYVKQVQERMGLVYGQHFWPHDGNKKILATGTELWKTAADMGLKVHILEREQSVTDGIERVRKTIPYCTFDEDECTRGVEALEHYQRKKNQSLSTDEKTVFLDVPLHDWASDGADSFRGLTVAVRKLGMGGMSQADVQEMMTEYGYGHLYEVTA